MSTFLVWFWFWFRFRFRFRLDRGRYGGDDVFSERRKNLE